MTAAPLRDAPGGDGRAATGNHARIRVGCAGWAIPAAHRARFGSGDSVLARYATRFDMVEVNSSFYRPHRRATWARWADTVPPGFRFAVKVPRAITHEARLRATGPLLDRFLDECGGLGPKLGVLLVQLPPSLRFEPRTAPAFMAQLRARTGVAVALEPRHASWFGPCATEALCAHGLARVAADPALHPGAGTPAAAPALAYWRWHGSPEVYCSAYPPEDLAARARAVCADAASRREAWVVFDNTAHGHATADALGFARACAAACGDDRHTG